VTGSPEPMEFPESGGDAAGVKTRNCYPDPVRRPTSYQETAERRETGPATAHVLALPVEPQVTSDDVEHVIRATVPS